MISYSVQLRDRAFAKGFGFLFFAKDMGKKNISKKISKNLSGRYNHKFIGHVKQSADAFKTALKSATKKQQKRLMIWLVMTL